MKKLLSLIFIFTISAPSFAAVPSNSTYTNFTGNFGMQDELNNALGFPSFLICFTGQLNPIAMLEKDVTNVYLALVNEKTCEPSSVGAVPDTSKAASAASGASTTKYTDVVANVLRASSSDPVISQAWVSLTEEGGPSATVFMQTNITGQVTDSSPYGAFEIDYTAHFDQFGADFKAGYLKANNTKLEWSDVSYDQQNNEFPSKSIINLLSGTAGNGAIRFPDEESGVMNGFVFAYDDSNFCRQLKTLNGNAVSASEQCFFTDEAKGKKEVFGYKLFDSVNGEPYDISNVGFGVKATIGGVVKHGWADFNGIWFDVTVPSGTTLTKGSDGSQYTSEILGHKVTKFTVSSATLDSIDGLRFETYLDSSIPGINSGQEGQYKLYYDKANAKFVIISKFNNCDGGTCVFVSLSSNIDITTSTYLSTKVSCGTDCEYDLQSMFGWAEGYGELVIPRDAISSPTATKVIKKASAVIPASEYPSTLYCLVRCMRYTEIEAEKTKAFNNQSASSDLTVTAGASQSNYGTNDINDIVTYSINSSTGQYSAGDGGDLTYGSTSSEQNAQLEQFGLRNGSYSSQLVTSISDFSGDDSNGNAGEDWTYSIDQLDKGGVATFYAIQSGHQAWSKQTSLKDSSGDLVSFGRPQRLYFNVPNDVATYAEYAGKELPIEFGGGMNVWGIPGRCLNTDTGAFVEDCSKGGGEYWPWIDLFKIPKNETTGRLYENPGATGTYYLIAPADGVVFLGKNDDAIGTLTMGNLSDLPTDSIVNRGPNGGSTYIGASPTKPTTVSIKDGEKLE